MAISGQRVALYRGERFEFDFAIVDGNGAPVDITGWPLALVICAQQEDTINELKKTIADGITITSGAGGLGNAVLAKADTGTLNYGAHWWALIYDDPTNPAMLAEGSLTVKGPRIL